MALLSPKSGPFAALCGLSWAAAVLCGACTRTPLEEGAFAAPAADVTADASSHQDALSPDAATDAAVGQDGGLPLDAATDALTVADTPTAADTAADTGADDAADASTASDTDTDTGADTAPDVGPDPSAPCKTSPTQLFITAIEGPTHERFGAAARLGSGHVVVGRVATPAPLGNQGWVVTLDSAGKQVASHQYGGNGDEDLRAVQVLPGGDLLLAGLTSTSAQGGHDGWLLRTKADGSEVWSLLVGGPKEDWLEDIALDGNVVYAVGTGVVSDTSGADMMLAVSGVTGMPPVPAHLGGSGADEGMAVAAIPGKGAIAAGISRSTADGVADGWLVLLGAAGTPNWSRRYGGPTADALYDVVVQPDGGFVAAGSTVGPGFKGSDPWLLKVDGQGNPLWQQTAGDNAAEVIRALLPMADGGFGLVGRKGLALMLGRVDSAGNPVWERLLDSEHSYEGLAGAALPGGGLLAVGLSRKVALGVENALAVRTDAWGHTDCQQAAGCADQGWTACADLNPCTADGCKAGGCTHVPMADGTSCGEGMVCLAASCKPAWAREVAAGGMHTCALRGDRKVSCWGANNAGQLGDGTVIARPEPVTVGGLKDVIALAAGWQHTCAVVASGQVWCWGDNTLGQLGIGPKDPAPVTEPKKTGALVDAIAIGAGKGHTCALRAEGQLLCWGDNALGQIGAPGKASSDSPLPVSGVAFGVALAAGHEHSCVMQGHGHGLCVGAASWGQIGHGTAPTKVTTPQEVSALNNMQTLAAGAAHTCAGLRNGQVSCWGRNDEGQLGNGSTDPKTAQPLAATVKAVLGAEQVAAGSQHTCARVVAGVVRCWGRGAEGQLGNGWTNEVSTPVTATGLSGTVDLSLGHAHSCAVRLDGSVWCWGDNTHGQLGTGKAGGTQTKPTSIAVSAP